MLLFTVILLLSSELFGFSIVNIHNNLNHWNFQSLRKAYSSLIEAADHRREPAVSTEFEKVVREGPIPPGEREFIIQGWRWHTMAVLRDLDRFTKIIQKSQEQASSGSSKDEEERTIKLGKCFDFVFGFNWKSLIRVEKDIFFPWLQDILPDSSKKLISTIIAKHSRINELIAELGSACKSCETARQDNVIAMLAELRESATEIQRMQVSTSHVLFPTVTKLGFVLMNSIEFPLRVSIDLLSMYFIIFFRTIILFRLSRHTLARKSKASLTEK